MRSSRPRFMNASLPPSAVQRRADSRVEVLMMSRIITSDFQTHLSRALVQNSIRPCLAWPKRAWLGLAQGFRPSENGVCKILQSYAFNACICKIKCQLRSEYFPSVGTAADFRLEMQWADGSLLLSIEEGGMSI